MTITTNPGEKVNVELPQVDPHDLGIACRERAEHTISLLKANAGLPRRFRANFLRPIGWDGRQVAG